MVRLLQVKKKCREFRMKYYSKTVKPFILYFISICISIPSLSQKEFNLRIISSDLNEKKNFTFQDSSNLTYTLSEYLNMSYTNGYLTASFDSIRRDSTSVTAYLYKGDQLVWGNISSGNIDDKDLNKMNIKFGWFNGKPINISILQKNINKLIEYYESKGYPFASISLKNIEFTENKINAELFLDKHRFYKIDTTIFEGYTFNKPVLLNRLFNIRIGEMYTEAKIKTLSSIVNSYGFLEEIRPAEVEFTTDKASLYIYLKKRNTNWLSGVAGIMPNSKTTGKLLLTGDINLYLANLFKHAETIKFEWQKLESSTQLLDIYFDYPYMCMTNFATDLYFNFYKKDTSYLNVGYNIGFNYLFSNRSHAGLFIKQTKSNVIHYADMATDYADLKTTMAGLSYHFSSLKNQFNPRKGIECDFSIADGKKILTNTNDSTINKVEGLFSSSIYFPCFSHFVTKIHNYSGFQTGNNLYNNELFFLGGIQSFRGVEEKSILASAFSIFSLELRYIFEENSNLFIFSDAGKYQDKSVSENRKGNLWSTGIGVNLNTRSGIFSLTYAINKPEGKAFELRSAKIHIGYLNRF